MAQNPVVVNETQVQFGPDYKKTFEKYRSQVDKRWLVWLAAKIPDPLRQVGRTDYPFSSSGNYSGLSHAHLTKDISVVYKVSGKSPRNLKIFGFFSHEDLGTGAPPKLSVQRAVGNRLLGQVFEDYLRKFSSN